MMRKSDSYVCSGDAVKALAEPGRIGGYLVRFSTKNDPDLTGEFFTAKTYFGPRDGDGVDVLFNHGVPLKSGLEPLADHLFKPLKAAKDEIGIWVEVALDAANKFERAVYELVKSGKLGWSSGTAGHLVKKAASGEILRWPIIEGSLTPTPAEPRNMASPIKSLSSLIGLGARTSSSALCADRRSFEQTVRDALGLSAREAKALAADGWRGLAKKISGESEAGGDTRALLETLANRLRA